MKKIFALALAAVMTAGMTTVAFAVQDEVGLDIGGAGDFYELDTDNRTAVAQDNEFEGGDIIAIPVYVHEDTDNDGTLDTWSLLTYTSDYDRNVTARAEWKVGKDLGAEIDTGWVNYSEIKGSSDVATSNDDQIMSVIITLPENDTTTIEDLAGTISVGRTASAAKNSNDVFKLDISFYPDANVRKTNFDGGELESGKTGVVSFQNGAGEIDIDFEDIATFIVDVDGQGKLNLAWNTTFNKEFGAMYNYANLHFINFEGTPSFNKTGTMYIYADKETYLYEVTDDGAKAIAALPTAGAATAELAAGEINGLKWNEDYEAWEFKTRKLTSYVLSDVELDEKTVTEDTSSSTTDGGKDNPDTGR